MLSREKRQTRDQIQMLSIEELVPKDHLLRDIDRAINFDFIYDAVGGDQQRPGGPRKEAVQRKRR
ncbi:MAG: hypothetical protein FWC62_03465 [Firmicutes bacterium]|nr:hypothetical protein [Bacillota bacterium]